jgi:hypothetical protein
MAFFQQIDQVFGLNGLNPFVFTVATLMRWGMAHFVIIDPALNSRNILKHQLSQVMDYTLLQFPTLNEARAQLMGRSPMKGVLLTSTTEGLPELTEFVQFLREEHKNMSVIAFVDSLSLDEMRSLVVCGVDQIMLKPFNLMQLKDKIIAAENFRQQVNNESLSKPTGTILRSQFEQVMDRLYKVTLSGWLTENCELPEIRPSSPGAAIFIDCDHLKGLNSVGVRSWILWFKALVTAGFNRFELENLRPAMLQQASMIQGFIPESATVNSFYLTYWNSDTDEEKEFRISKGKDFASDKMTLPKFHEVTVKGVKVRYAIDDSVKRFLKFYRGQIELI